MNSRRKYLAGIGAAAAVSLSGCTDALNAEQQQREAPEEVTIEMDAFHPSSEGTCADMDSGDASIEQNPNFDNSMMFEGTLLTPDPAHEAVLASKEYDAETGVAKLVIEAESTSSDDEANMSCVGEVGYSGGLRFVDGVPLELHIEHNTSADDAVTTLEL